ncbi:Cardiolipin synthase (CMP-forming) [Chlorella vulgaris]
MAAATAAALCRRARSTPGLRAGLQLPSLAQLLREAPMCGPQATSIHFLACASPWAVPPPPQQRDELWPHNRHQQQPARCTSPLSLQLFSTSSRPGSDGSGLPRPSSDPQQQVAQPQTPGQRQQAAAGKASATAALRDAGWSRREVYNLPNALSMLRLLLGPWSLAVPVLAVSAATDWADGYAARHLDQPSVIGSYLDPLADKVLICSVIAALGWSGVLPAPVVALVVGRDVVLVSFVCAARVKSLGPSWPGWAEFFRVQPAAAPAAPASDPRHPSSAPGGGAAAAVGGGGGTPAPAAPLVKPLYVSKVNTVFQLGLVGACMLKAWLGWPGEEVVWAASGLTAGTTVWSSWAYLRAYQQNKLLLARPATPQ